MNINKCLYYYVKCSHATLGCYKKAVRNPKLLMEWESTGQAKVVVKCETENDL